MLSMTKRRVTRQEIPDLANGIVMGIDISKDKLDFGLFRPDSTSDIIEVSRDMNGFLEIKRICDAITAQGKELWVGYEPTGSYDYCLKGYLESMDIKLVQVNPYQVKRSKELRDNSPEKSDFKDPGVIADLVWQGMYYKPVKTESIYEDIRYSYHQYNCLNGYIVSLRNVIQSQLERWFPELMTIFSDPLCKSSRLLINKYDSVGSILKQKKPAFVDTMYGLNKHIGKHRFEDIYESAQHSISKSYQEGLIYSIRTLLSILEFIETRRDELLRVIEELLSKIDESKYLLSIPYFGIITVAGIFSECGDICNFNSAKQIEKHLGLGLFSLSSGKMSGEKHISKRGRALGRYILCSAAVLQMKKGGLYYEYAMDKKKAGKKPMQIAVSIARKLISLIYSLSKNRSYFDTNRYFTDKLRYDHYPYKETQAIKAA